MIELSKRVWAVHRVAMGIPDSDVIVKETSEFSCRVYPVNLAGELALSVIVAHESVKAPSWLQPTRQSA